MEQEHLARTVDLHPLTAPVDRGAVRAFWRGFRAAHPLALDPFARRRRIILLVATCLLPIVLLAFGTGLVDTYEEERGGDRLASQMTGLSLFAALTIGAYLLMAWNWWRLRRRAATPERHYRLLWLARDNGWLYLPEPERLSYLTPWRTRHPSVATSRMRLPSSRFVELGDHEMMEAATGRRSAAVGGYVAIRLRTTLPHIVLDARATRSPASLFEPSLDRTQRLSLEGDFDRHYRLYCPRGYERDALYLFTPDVMARFIDTGRRDRRGDATPGAIDPKRALDVEIVDDWLILTTPRDAVTLDPQTWMWLLGAAASVQDKIAQWERWRDERATAPDAAAVAGRILPLADPTRAVVAPQGRRLVVRTLPALIAVGGVIALWFGILQLSYLFN